MSSERPQPIHSRVTPLRLTPRQTRVFQYLAEGASDDEIGSALGLDPEAVQILVSRVLRATGASRTEIAARPWVFVWAPPRSWRPDTPADGLNREPERLDQDT